MQVARELPRLQSENGSAVADLSFREALGALAAPVVAVDGELPSGEYGAAVQTAAELVELIAGANASWWTVAERTYEATTGEDAVSLERWCADVSTEAGRPFTVREGEIRRAAWIAYGAMPA